MIDLTLLEDRTFDIKINENLILNIRKPNNQMFKDLYKMVQIMGQNGEEDKIMNAMYLFLSRVMNRNKNNKKFSQAEIEELFDFDVAVYIIKAYQDWTEEVVKELNF